MLIIQRTTCMLICTKIINNQMLHCKLLYMATQAHLALKSQRKIYAFKHYKYILQQNTNSTLQGRKNGWKVEHRKFHHALRICHPFFQ